MTGSQHVDATPEAVARHPAVPGACGLIAGGLVFGVASYVAILLVVDRPRLDVGGMTFSAVFFAVGWGVATGWWSRRRQPAHLGGLPHAARPATVDSRQSFARGVLRAAVMTGVLAVIVAVYVSIGSVAGEVSGPIGFLPGGLVGLSIATAIGLRGQRRWQHVHGLEVFTRRGGRRFAWTNAQTGDQLVVVPMER